MKAFKDVARFFALVILFGALVPVLYSLMSTIVEARGDDYANKQVNVAEPQVLNKEQLASFNDSVQCLKRTARRNYIDSVSTIPWINLPWVKTFFNYRYGCDHGLRFGVGLNGGIKLVVAISQEDLLRKISDNNSNPQFNSALLTAKKINATTGGDFITIFKQEFEKLGPKAKLAPIFIANEDNQGKININSTNEEVIAFLRKDCEAATRRTFLVIVSRAKQLAVMDPNVTYHPETGLININLPGIDDPGRVNKLVMQTAQLEFWDTYEARDAITYFSQANTLLDKEIRIGYKVSTFRGKVGISAGVGKISDGLGR